MDLRGGGDCRNLVGVAAVVQHVWPLRFLISAPALAFQKRDWIIVADVNNLTGDPVFDKSLRLALEVAIGQSQYVNVYPASRVAATLQRMQRRVDRFDEAAAAEVAVREGVRGVLACDIAQLGNVYALTARLIPPEDARARNEPVDPGLRARTAFCPPSTIPPPACDGAWANRSPACRRKLGRCPR